MYSSFPSVVIGFHGCDKAVAEKILSSENQHLSKSSNVYDWLGGGIYFWENSPTRALEYAEHLKENPSRSKKSIKEPAVIGAVINLGRCFNLLDSHYLGILKQNFEYLKKMSKKSGFPIPENKPVGSQGELLFRKLDCAVIALTHQLVEAAEETPYDSVRGVFVEGDALYENAGFHEKNHIQICIRNPNCIKGYFRPLDNIEGYPLV